MSQRTRAEINRANADEPATLSEAKTSKNGSTGPKTAEGKAASSKNAFKHGHYSKNVCIPGEDPEKLDALRADLRAEHHPATLTEELLVDEMAQHYWRMKRYRYFESSIWSATGRNAEGELCANTERVLWSIDHGLAVLYHRALVSAERAFYKALNTLRQLKNERGFVPQSSKAVASAPPPSPEPALAAASGFVPQNAVALPVPPPLRPGFVLQKIDLSRGPSNLPVGDDPLRPSYDEY